MNTEKLQTYKSLIKSIQHNPNYESKQEAYASIKTRYLEAVNSLDKEKMKRYHHKYHFYYAAGELAKAGLSEEKLYDTGWTFKPQLERAPDCLQWLVAAQFGQREKAK